MRIGRRKLIGAVVGVLVAGAALVAWLVGGTDLLIGVVLVAVLVGVGGLGYLIAQSERRLRTELNANMDRRFDALTTELSGRLQRPGEQFEAVLRAIKASHVRLEEELAATVDTAHRHQAEELAAVVEASDRLQAEELIRVLHEHRVQMSERQGVTDQMMLRQFNHAPAEIDALMQVHRRLKLEDPLPLMGGWGLSPRGMLQALELVEAPESPLIVECGSGTSTVFLARALQLRETGLLIALEHLPEYAEKAQKALEMHGIEEFAEVRLAPLEEIDVKGTSYMWYALSAVSDLNAVDVLLVDGPPAATGTWARYPAYPMLRGALNDSAVILVDDIGRRDERAMVDEWLRMGGLAEIPSVGPDQVMLRTD